MANRNYEHEMRVWSARTSERVEMLNGIKGFATLSIKSLLFFNGGAVLALMTFLGNVLTKSSVVRFQVISFEDALFWFSAGIASALLCSMIAYIAQVVVYEAEGSYVIIGYGLRITGVFLAILSFVCFCFGSFTAIDALNLLK